MMIKYIVFLGVILIFELLLRDYCLKAAVPKLLGYCLESGENWQIIATTVPSSFILMWIH